MLFLEKNIIFAAKKFCNEKIKIASHFSDESLKKTMNYYHKNDKFFTHI